MTDTRARTHDLARAGLANLEAHRRRIDDLNVYPVPDGDTGTNMTLTVRAVVDALAGSQATEATELAAEVTRAALLGARGNSGVILSQIVRGLTSVLPGNGLLDAATVATALRAASDAAYKALRHPVEGTMLTVIREMAEEAEKPEVQQLALPDSLRRVLTRAESAVERTPQQLDILARAGVVDAGGVGLLELARGLVAGATGEALPNVPEEAGISLEAVHLELSHYRYCTVLVVEGDALDASVIEERLDSHGDSVLVAGDSQTLKLHVHTDDPGGVLTLASQYGVIDGIEIVNMHRQTLEREARLTDAGLAHTIATPSAVVVVACGDGNRRLFRSGGAAQVIDGGATMNPTAAELVSAVDATHAEEVILLPNNRNVLLTARLAAELASKPVRVVPTDSIQAGLAAITRFISARSAEANEADMREAVESIVAGGVTTATRDVELDGVAVRAGAWLGLVEAKAVCCDDDFLVTADAVVERLVESDGDVLTLITGPNLPVEPESLVSRYQPRFPAETVALSNGGQPHYPLLAWVE